MCPSYTYCSTWTAAQSNWSLPSLWLLGISLHPAYPPLSVSPQQNSSSSLPISSFNCSITPRWGLYDKTEQAKVQRERKKTPSLLQGTSKRWMDEKRQLGKGEPTGTCFSRLFTHKGKQVRLLHAPLTSKYSSPLVCLAHAIDACLLCRMHFSGGKNHFKKRAFK